MIEPLNSSRAVVMKTNDLSGTVVLYAHSTSAAVFRCRTERLLCLYWIGPQRLFQQLQAMHQQTGHSQALKAVSTTVHGTWTCFTDFFSDVI